ncbi:cytochrome c oxidase assembly protein COX18, mitochondrial-like [Tubulanus polymorphus]|uniref:cytochrome c oxidase assembly protein COX18, mitochondrial-like n=1 Tax=Tubulanus polymorphus TaxID=672921 RepID=UPI003DA661F8
MASRLISRQLNPSTIMMVNRRLNASVPILLANLSTNNSGSYRCTKCLKMLSVKDGSISNMKPVTRQTALLATNHNVFNFEQRRNFSADFYNNYLSAESPPIGLAQNILEYVHCTTGLPWWASIMLTTFGLRTIVTLPLAVYSQKIIAKVELLQPEIMALSKRLKLEVAQATQQFKWDKKLARRKYNSTMKKLIKDLYIRENSHPFKASLVVWIQLPMWICLSFALRNMSGYVPIKGVEATVLAPGFVNEGALWFSNLCLADTTFILPVTLGLLNLIIIEMNALQNKKPTKFHTRITYLLRGVSLVMIPIAACVPSSMSWYWTCSSFYGLLQNVLMKYPSIKRMMLIPATPSESKTPFQDMYAEFIIKYDKSLKKLGFKNVQKPLNNNK